MENTTALHWQLFHKIFDSLIDYKIPWFKNIQEEYLFFIRNIKVAMNSGCPVINRNSELRANHCTGRTKNVKGKKRRKSY